MNRFTPILVLLACFLSFNVQAGSVQPGSGFDRGTQFCQILAEADSSDKKKDEGQAEEEEPDCD